MFFAKQNFDDKQIKMNKFIFEVKQLKLKKIINSIWQLVISTFNAYGTFVTPLLPML